MLSTLKKKMNIYWMTFIPVIMIALGLAVAGCGNKAEGNSTAPPGAQQQATAATQSENNHIRIEFTTTGDYADLNVYNPEQILSVELVSVLGNPSNYVVAEDSLALNQPIDDAQQGAEIGITVEYEIAMDTSDSILDFRLQSSPINSSFVRIYHLVGDEFQLVHEEEYQRSMLPAGYKHLDFSFDLNAMADVPPQLQASPTPYRASDHILRVELTATSDYALFRILQPEHILSVNFIATSGNPSDVNYHQDGLSLGQPLSSAESGGVVGLTVDFVVEGSAYEAPLDFQLQSGALNGSSAKIYNFVDGGFQLVHEVEYRRSTSAGGRKFLHFTFDLNTMSEVYSSGDHCSRFDGLDLGLVLHTIEPDDTVLTIYAKFPDKVIGVEGENDPLVYIAQLGDSPSLECSAYEGEKYAGRLYCYHEFLPEYKNSNRPWSLYVEGCEEAVFTKPLLSLQVTIPEKEKGEASGSACGSEPAPCTGDYTAWCACQGLYMYCSISYVNQSEAISYCQPGHAETYYVIP